MRRILLITDDWTHKKVLKSGLLERGFTMTRIASADVFSEQFVPPDKLDVLVVDLERCETESAKLVHALRRERSLKELPLVLLVTEALLGRIDFAWGIEDYLTLPVSVTRLAERLNDAEGERRLTPEAQIFGLNRLERP